jgi:type VI secretion system protein VasJ
MIAPERAAAISISPVPGDEAVGSSIRYDEAFTQLETELAKLEQPAGGEVDWRLVEQGSADLLATRSKDLLLAAWLVRASWHRDGVAGLASGLGILRDLLANFGDHLHPQRTRPRRAALEWLGDKLAAIIDDRQLAADAQATAHSIAAIEAIIAWSAGRFDGADCGLTGLLARLRAGSLQVAAEAVQADVVATPGAMATASAQTGAITSRAQAVARLRELGDWFATHEPLSPIAPLLRRAEAWSGKDFQAVFGELLRHRQDARDHLWDVLGIVEGAPQE